MRASPARPWAARGAMAGPLFSFHDRASGGRVPPQTVAGRDDLGTVLRGRTILVAEDEYFVASDIAAALSRHGARVAGPVATLGEALGLVAARPGLDGAVLDVNLQGKTSYAVADALEARGIPFVFATGYDRAHLPRRFASAPHWDKPFDADALARELSTLPWRDRGTLPA